MRRILVHPISGLAGTVSALLVVGVLAWGTSSAEGVEKKFDLLKIVDPDEDGLDGGWTRKGEILQVRGEGRTRLRMPVRVEGSYRMVVRFRRTAGEGPLRLNLIFPVGQGRQCLVKLSGPDDVSGLARINDHGYDSDGNPTRTEKFRLRRGVEHVVAVAVQRDGEKVSITVEADGKPLITWKGAAGVLSILDYYALGDTQAVGLCVESDSAVEFTQVGLTVIDGRAEPSRGRADLKRGLLAHWTFDRVIAGVARDELGRRHGEVNGATAVAGVVGGALMFDGKDDYVDFGAIGEVRAATYAMWLKVSSLDREFNAFINCHGWPEGGVHFQYRQNGGVVLTGNTGTPSQAAEILGRKDFGQWHHLAATIDSGVVQYFLDGRRVKRFASPLGSKRLLIGPARIGGWKDVEESGFNPDRWFHGAMDDVRIYGRALSAREVGALASMGRGLIGPALAAPPPAGPRMAAEEAEKVFRQVFGADVDRVAATADRSDDIEFAARLLAIAAQSREDPAVVDHMLEQVVELGRKGSGGYETAIGGLTLLMHRQPAQREKHLDRLLPLRQHQVDRARGTARTEIGKTLLDETLEAARAHGEADHWSQAIARYRQAIGLAGRYDPQRRSAIQSALNTATTQLRLVGKIDQLKARIKAARQAGNAAIAGRAAEELLKVLVIERDDPGEARKFTFLSSDAAWKKNVVRAARPIDSLEEEELHQLARWYRGLAGSAPPMAKGAMLTRARDYARRYLDLHGTSDLKGKAQQIALKQIEAELDKLTVASGRKSRWVDLTKAFVAAMRESSTEKGRVDFKNGVFSLKDSVGVAVPIESPDVMASVEMRYVEGSQVKLEVRHTGKQCYFAWYSGDGQFTLGRWIKDDGITELVTKRLPSFNDRRFFELRLAALGDTLMVFVDGEQVIRTQDTELSAPGRVVMYVHQATAHYRKIRVRYPTPGEIKQMLAKKPG